MAGVWPTCNWQGLEAGTRQSEMVEGEEGERKGEEREVVEEEEQSVGVNPSRTGDLPHEDHSRYRSLPAKREVLWHTALVSSVD